MYNPGSEDAPESYFESVAAVLTDNRQPEGSGVLIAPNLLITAAHVNTREGHEVFFGESLSEFEDGEFIRIIKRIPHWEYNPEDKIGDLAILVLEYPPENINPCPITYSEIQKELRIRTIGYGAVDESNQGAGTRRETSEDGMLIVFSPNCEDFETQVDFGCSKGSFVADHPDGWDSCKGDSGGAGLIFEDGIWKLAGIINKGVDGHGIGLGTAYARLGHPPYREWLEEMIFRLA